MIQVMAAAIALAALTRQPEAQERAGARLVSKYAGAKYSGSNQTAPGPRMCSVNQESGLVAAMAFLTVHVAGLLTVSRARRVFHVAGLVTAAKDVRENQTNGLPVTIAARVNQPIGRETLTFTRETHVAGLLMMSAALLRHVRGLLAAVTELRENQVMALLIVRAKKAVTFQVIGSATGCPDVSK